MSDAPSPHRLPAIDGSVCVDGPLVAECSEDFGHILRQRPLAVVRPASVEDVVRTVRFARAHRLPVAVRGQGHSTYGQSLVAGGLVIDMRSLDAIHAVRPGAADVQAGAGWSRLLDVTLREGRTPPVLTDYLDLSVGGTLSVGGVGGTSHAWGRQIDTVTELDVVTGAGEVRTCSARREPDLFDAVLGGLGQVAVMVRATVGLVPAPARVRSYMLIYDDLSSLIADQVRVVREGRAEHLQGRIGVGADGRWELLLDIARFHTTDQHPCDATVLSGLRHRGPPREIEDRSYRAFAHRLDDPVTEQRQAGTWSLPHPWFDAWIPGRQVTAYVAGVLAQLEPEDLLAGTILLVPIRRSRRPHPLAQLPDDGVVFQFDILGTAPATPAAIRRALARNRRLFEQARDMGGRRYPIGAIPFRPDDWRRQLGSAWPAVRAARTRHDPDGVLNPGPGVFTSETG
jgi:cytokinin dehydrogenase